MEYKMKESLRDYAEWLAGILSDPKMNKENKAAEIFYTQTVQPLSEDTAGIIYRKEPSKLKAAIFVFYAGGQWWRCTATDSHVTGMLLFPFIKVKVERQNYEITHGQKT